MDCREHADRIAELLDGSARPGDREAAEAHRRFCRACEAHWNSLDISRAIAPPADLLGSILDRTSGRPCDSARDGLCDYVDAGSDAPASIDRLLLGGHLEHCPDCGGLARTLERMAVDLPRLAEFDPGADFLGSVLERTVYRQPAWRRLAASLRNGWGRALQRPRFALEGAYLGTFALVLIFGIPGSPLAALPRQVLNLASANPVGTLSDSVETELRSKIGSGTTSVSNRSRSLIHDVGQFSSSTIESVVGSAGTIWESFASMPVQEDESGETDPASDDEQREKHGDPS